MVVNLALGMITPPFGVNLFAACTVARISLDRIVGHLLPFVGVVIGCLMVITYVPSISLTLRDRFGDEETGVLVPAHLAADVRLLEDQHALPDLRRRQAQVGVPIGQGRAVREGIEHRVAVVQRMADLVDGAFLGHAQAALVVQRFFLEEAVHLVG
jgi:hypothetical protein